MAHGFRHVPRRRTASPRPEQRPPCPWCERYHGPGKCLTYGTAVTPTKAIPLERGGE